jgi:2-oxoglutarate dehydrogenase E1 component
MMTTRVTTTGLPTTQKLFSSTDSFANVYSANYLEEMEQKWLSDPLTVDPQWRQYFTQLQREGPSIPSPTTATTYAYTRDTESLGHKISDLVRAFQVNGHRISDLDPLKLYSADLDNSFPQELSLENYGFTEEDMDKPMTIGRPLMKGFLDQDRPPITLRQLLNRLREVYCSTIGWEYMHINSRQQCNWIRERIETPTNIPFQKQEQLVILERLLFSDTFEQYCASKYPTTKRFGLEGCESLIPGLKSIIDTASSLGCSSFVMGMAHRGRLNVLANVLRKPLENLFAEFQGNQFSRFGSGDVKYHLGASCKRVLPYNNKEVELSLVANPSHLEAVDPVVEGKTRAKQYYSKDTDRTRNMSILIHGDASFSGQGIVYETMGLSDLYDYTTGGTLHIIINNQIGFTTNPKQSRSSPYATDLAKFIGAPVFHCNGDDPEAVVRVCKLAAQWRQEFHKDVIVDIICYRKFGHNEMDQPMFTQPIMYKKIAKHPSILKIYSEKLLNSGVLTKEDFEKMQSQVKTIFDEAYKKSMGYVFDLSSEWYGARWSGIKPPDVYSKVRTTGVNVDTLKLIGDVISKAPEGFHLHPGVKKVLEGRAQMISSGQGLDWGTAEHLAFGSLLLEKYHVRLSGQDVERGTFSHRHSVLVHQDTEERYIPLNHISKDQAEFHVSNSSLSEYGVLGFELGYSLENPNALVIWEAQFGDFANGAQIIIDQFLSSGEQKWYRSSGLTLLLPHGYEGQGPEHSNARLERFLQLTDEDPDTYPEDLAPEITKQIQRNNWQVLNCSTPANYFHALRRQLHRDFRKPLIIMTPKSLLRKRLSNLSEFAEGTRFIPVYPDCNPKLVAPDKVRRLIFCTGKVYYDLMDYVEEQNKNGKGEQVNNIAIVRIEQLSPFPFDKVSEAMQKYPNAEIFWTQEEPKNYGAWNHFYFRAQCCMRHIGRKNQNITFVGRHCSASPSTGFSKVHKEEQEKIVKDSFA